MNDVRFEGMEERLDVRVLVRGSTARHALAQPMGGEALPERLPLKFAAPVAVKDDPRRWPATTERRVHDRADEPRGSRAGHPPGEDSPRPLIKDHGQIPPAPPGREIGEVRHPDLIGPRGLSPAHVIRLPPEPAMRPGLRAIHAHQPGAAARGPHQALDPPATDALPTRSESPTDPGTPIRPAAALEDRTYFLEQDPVLPRPRTDRPLPPRVVARPRDMQEPAQARHREGFPFLVDEREDRGFRAEVNRMSFFRRACSSCNS